MSRPILYLDANLFIDLVEGPEFLKRVAEEIFAWIESHPGTACTSELTIAEVLAPSRSRSVDPKLRDTYLALLERTGLVDLRPITRDLLMATVEVRSSRSVRLPDAIHIATASSAGCMFVVSRDRRLSDLPAGLERFDTEDDPLSRLETAFASFGRDTP